MATEAEEPTRTGEDGASVLTLLERRDAVTDELERNLARRLKRVLADEQNAVLDAVRRARKLPSPDDVIPDPPEHEGSYAAAAVEDLDRGRRGRRGLPGRGRPAGAARRRPGGHARGGVHRA